MSTNQRKGVFVDGDGRPVYWGREGDYSGPGTFLDGWVSNQVGHKPSKGQFRMWDFVNLIWIVDTVKEQEWTDMNDAVRDDKVFRRTTVDALMLNLGNSATTRADLDDVVRVLDNMVKPV